MALGRASKLVWLKRRKGIYTGHIPPSDASQNHGVSEIHRPKTDHRKAWPFVLELLGDGVRSDGTVTNRAMLLHRLPDAAPTYRTLMDISVIHRQPVGNPGYPRVVDRQTLQPQTPTAGTGEFQKRVNCLAS